MALAALAACQGDSINSSGAGSAAAATVPQPSISLQSSAASVSSGQTVTLQWSVVGAQACSATGGWSGNMPASGSIATAPLSETTTYTLTCTGNGGSSTQSRQITVTHSSLPTITLTALPTTLTQGAASTLTWTAMNATACSASGGWNGSVATQGSWSTGALSNSTEYQLTCTGAGGSVSQGTTVTVGASAPAVMLHASPSTVQSGAASSLQWSTTDATSCVASGAWSGTKGVSGAQSTGPVTASSTYTLTCTGLGGQASQSTTVTVAAPAPSVSLTATPSTLTKGATATLSWKATNATTCSASGAWGGAEPTSGSQSTGIVDAGSTYTLTCQGAGGAAATQSATVSVKSPLPTVSLSVGPSSVAHGGNASLTWSSPNATSCVASGAWSGVKPTSGSQSTGALTATARYALACTGPGGSAAQSATVSVQTAAPTVRLSASPSSIANGSASTLSWSAANATSCTAYGAWLGIKGTSGSQSTGALTASATYVLSCTGSGGTATQSTSVTVSPKAVPTITLSASPSTVAIGAAATLSWSSTNATSCSASGAWAGAKATSDSQATAALTANATYSLTCTGVSGNAIESTTVTVTQPAPTVSLSASPSTVNSGDGSTISWSSNHATACTASGAWSGGKAVSGSQPTGALTANATYVITCTGAGGNATQSASVAVNTPTPAPTITLSGNPSTISSGKSATLTWSTSHATSCAASGAWSGNPALSGSQSTGALKSSATYTLTCTGSGGSATQSTTMTVTSPPPTITLSANPATVQSGSTSQLTWSSANATSCSASGAWSGTVASSGSQSTAALTSSAAYTLTCTGGGGSATQSTTVTVNTPAPTINLAANPSTVNSGAPSTLDWYATNATSCAASGGWSGSEPTTGSATSNALSATTQFTLTCTGAGGSASQSTTVSVTSGTAALSWAAPTTDTNGSAVTPLTGYTVFYGTSESNLTQSVTVSGASTTSYTVTGLTAGTWYFAVAANAADGTQSALSNIGSKTF